MRRSQRNEMGEERLKEQDEDSVEQSEKEAGEERSV